MANINEVMQALITLSSNSPLGPDTQVIFFHPETGDPTPFPLPILFAHPDTPDQPIVLLSFGPGSEPLI